MVARVSELYQRYLAQRTPRTAGKIRFHGVKGVDIYNPSAPFRDAKRWLIAARVEARASEMSEVCFFEWDGLNDALLVEDAPRFALQDPFVCWIDNQRVVGGVEVEFDAHNQPVRWRTQFWAGPSISHMRLMTKGPWGMKDIRLVSLPDDRVLVFTRPQGAIGGRGMIGWTIIDTLKDLNEAPIAKATLLHHVDSMDWCGVNSAQLLPDGRVEVLAHVAHFDSKLNRHYYAARFIFDYRNGESSPIEIVACRDDFLPGESKRDDLRDVVFPAGWLQMPEGRLLFCGTSDCEVQWLVC
ncbi:DUF1861 family protein [Pseudocitrobacter sp. 73]|uniref:DUF1861 family protein n=1 Tax=Pseudocitrobacter sp. 73 TaxID=2605731 RepID=UPI0011EC8F62|nr:DUF1861 family protein [Pseudocitrobacter sp. 73]KAA1046919.1 DUF1861 family protein [Pseudocitrobacter sp. 73]